MRTVVVLFLGLFFVNFFLPALFPTIAYYILRPLWWVESNVGAEQRDQSIALSHKNLIDENHDLRARVETLSEKLVTFDSLKNENEELRALGKSSTDSNKILAAVLAKPSVSPYDTLVIDVGEKGGIAVGDYVVAEGSIVLGRINEVHARFSKAVLLSSPGVETNVAIGKEKIQAVAYGQGAGTLFMKLPREYEIKEGDPIVVPELGNRAIGSAAIVGTDGASAFTKVLFNVPVNLFTLRWVTVEKNLIQ